MLIKYNINPLLTIIELDEHEQKELWYKIKIEQLTDRLFEAHYYLKDENNEKSREHGKSLLDPSYYLADKDDEKSKLDLRVDELFEYYHLSLKDRHAGDCTCIPCSCGKCHAEYLLGIDTIAGLGKHEASRVEGVMTKYGNFDEAINYLRNYKPVKDPNRPAFVYYDYHVPRRLEEAKRAADWLEQYKNEHFTEKDE